MYTPAFRAFFAFQPGEFFSLHIGQFQIFKQVLGQVLQTYIQFIIFIPFCTSCSIAGTWPFSRSGKTITPFFRSSSWCHPGAVFTINKAIFLKAPDRNLDDLVFALSNNALFCNYITNIFLDGFFHQLPVTSPVFSAPVPALAIIITENGQMDHSPKFFCI